MSAWSTTLLEASLFGCPIVLPYNPTQYYDVTADAVCFTPQEYWDKIISYINRDWTLDRSVKTFRWYWMVFFGLSLNVSSNQLRKSSLFEFIMRLCCVLPRKIYKNIPNNFKIKDAFTGQFKQIINRRVMLIDSDIISSSLLSNVDFLSNLNVKPSSSLLSNSNEEKACVREVLLKIFNVTDSDIPLHINKKSKCVRMLSGITN